MEAATVSVVVPAYNCARTLGTLVGRLRSVLDPRGAPYEIVLVNDGSRDGTWTIIRELAEGDSRVRGIDLMRQRERTGLTGVPGQRQGRSSWSW
jgi:polyisoprenyl-phosphate glycosyltransferase